MKAEVNQIFNSFSQKYSFISVEKSVVEIFVNENKKWIESNCEDVVLDGLQDNVGSQMLYDEIVY